MEWINVVECCLVEEFDLFLDVKLGLFKLFCVSSYLKKLLVSFILLVWVKEKLKLVEL